MAQTVIGIFKSAGEAQIAVGELLSKGFTGANVDVSSNGSSRSTSLSDTNKDENESGIGRFFKNLFGGDDNESERYIKAAGRNTVVTVHAQTASEADTAATLLDQYGAIDIDDQDKDYNNGDVVNVRSDDRSSSDYDAAGNTGRTIPIIEESLQVGKREVETGGVRLRSRIIEKPVEESLRLREEHVRIERKQVDRAATDADLSNFQEGTFELTERAEVPVVSKEARIVEEVSLGKEVEHRQETIRDTVRKTEVEIEDLESDLRSTSNTTL